MKQIQQNQIECIESFFVDENEVSITGGTPILSIRRQSDSKYYTGSSFTSTFSTLSMVEIDRTSQPGQYNFQFDTTGLSDDTYEVTSDLTGALNGPQAGELTVGGFVDNLDRPISSV